MSEGIVKRVMNYQAVRYVRWAGFALARVQVGLAIVMILCWKYSSGSQLRCNRPGSRAPQILWL